MDRTINAKELRSRLPDIVRRVRRGERFVVLYRSRPAFRLVPVDDPEVAVLSPLDEDPLFAAEALGASTDGATSEDHDRLLYAAEE